MAKTLQRDMAELCGLGISTCDRAVVGVVCSRYPRCLGSGLYPDIPRQVGTAQAEVADVIRVLRELAQELPL